MLAHGRLQHHFWRTYHASIALVFACETDAELALQKTFPMFSRGKYAHSRILRGTFSGKELAHVYALLRQHGAEMHKVYSLKLSIDYGEPFTVDVKLSDGSVQERMEF